jgi:hypothetical protein
MEYSPGSRGALVLAMRPSNKKKSPPKASVGAIVMYLLANGTMVGALAYFVYRILVGE